MSFSQTILIGRVGKDAEIVKVGDTTVAKFSIATSETWKDRNGEKQEATEWHNIEVWGKMAEGVGKWIEKGRELCVVGKITTQTWKKDGETKYKTVIRASDIKFIGKKEDKGGGSDRGSDRGRSNRDNDREEARSDHQTGNDSFPDDDIPF